MKPGSDDYIDDELERRLRAIEQTDTDDPARRDLSAGDMVALTAIVLAVVLLSLLWGFSG